MKEGRNCATLAGLLQRLGQSCDSGYALAVHIRLTRPTLLFQTYDAAWSDHYSVNGYMLFDPVVHWGMTQTGSIAWANLRDQDPQGVLQAAEDFGLYNGWCFAIDHGGSRTIAGLTRSDRAHSAAEMEEIREIVGEIHRLTMDFDQWPPEEQEAARALK